MFDGNFRSRRREVNLSGSNRRTGGNKRRDLLRNAEAQRKQRQERLRRQKASETLQRVTRGHLSRLQSIRDFVANVSVPESMNDHFIINNHSCNNHNLQRRMAALSVCLSHQILLAKFNTTRRDLLLGFQRISHNPDGTEENIYNRNSTMQQQNHLNLGEITSNTDSHPTEMFENYDYSESSSWFSQKRIIGITLEEFNPCHNHDGETNEKLFSLLNMYHKTIKIDDRMFLKLVTCMQEWCMFIDDKINSLSNESNGSDIRTDTTLSSGFAIYKNYVSMLTKWATDASIRLNNPNSEALLATILLGTSSKVAPRGNFDVSILKSEFQKELGHKNFQKWYTPLINVVRWYSTDGEHFTEKSDDRDLLMEATIENLRNHQSQKLLSSLLDITKSPQNILLINHVLRQPENEDLKLLVSLLARGDSISGKQKQLDEGTFDSNNVADDVEDSESEYEDFGQRPSSHKKARGGSMQFKRQELLTMVKLDRYYNERIKQAMEKHEHAFDATMIELANKIVKAPWKEWGLCILGESKNVGIDDHDDRIDKVEVDCYMEALSFLLQASSSMRPVAKFTPLSSLAFNPAILYALWKIAENKGECAFIWSVFSDLFSHYLLALSDDDFVKYHCSNSSSGSFENRINARDLVVTFGKQLHEVYWIKPVVCTEIRMDNVRGRLILSGTKLWNALYERWNRLVDVVFCEESAWWFPYMGSKEGDRAVIPDRELGQRDDGGDDDSNDMDIDEDSNQLSKLEEATDALADSFRDPKMARVLTSIPQALPFDRRVKLFHSLLKADKEKVAQTGSQRRALMAMRGQPDEEGEMMIWLDGTIREQVKIKRASLYKDSMETLNKMGGRLKHKIQVTFVNKHGAEEPGIDGGGVFKEFLDDLIKDGFASTNDDKTKGDVPRLFSITTKQQQLSINFDLVEDEKMLVHYEFLGRVLGKALYESILVEPQFCLPFLNQLLGKVNTLEDLKNFDEEYYKNLNKLRYYTEEEIESLELTFELTVGGTSPNSSPRTVNLIRSGRSIAVTKKNVLQYSQAVANELLNILGAHQTRAFLKGFRDLIKIAWIRLFSARELQKLISGDDSVRGIDVISLKKCVQYLGGYHESQPYIQDFWDILENELTPEQQRKFLRFMTSCSRQPLLGFSSLDPFPAIQQIRLKDEELSKNSRLPTSSTCMNLLKLPNYQDRTLLKEKLLAAVESGAGFELT
mmetsp:Transcript_8479/g.20805  ORF Transcript_8479/g.20805 Transcript_8479/m.20805 type:complete len:1204 (+) Transcript_8479:111-3722(+)